MTALVWLRRDLCEYLREPGTMPDDVQRRSGCVIGRDYPAQIVDRREARRRALERYDV